MKKFSLINIISFFIAFTFVFSYSCESFYTNINKINNENLYYFGEGKVLAVLDGDTIKIEITKQPVNSKNEFLGLNTEETIRLIGVNTPELNLNKNLEPEYYSQEAKEYTNQKLYLTQVLLKIDNNYPIRDKYGRLLAYVYSKEDEFINYELIKNGFGIYYDVFSFNPSYMELFEEAEIDAKNNKKGIWEKGD